MKYVLPPFLYNTLQYVVHGDYSRERKWIQDFRHDKNGISVEIGCGTGLISSFIEDGQYFGVDIDEDRVKEAQARYPQHSFRKWDLTEPGVEGLEKFDSVICNNAIHHLSDQQVANVLENFGNAAAKRGRPIEFIVLDPVLPNRPVLNLPGYFLAKLDRGDYVRSFDALVKLFDGYPVKIVEHVKGPMVWPVPGVVMTVSVG